MKKDPNIETLRNVLTSIQIRTARANRLAAEELEKPFSNISCHSLLAIGRITEAVINLLGNLQPVLEEIESKLNE